MIRRGKAAEKDHASEKIKRARPIPSETIALLRKTNGPPRVSSGIASRRRSQHKQKQK
jgi:hypothetical protein